MRIASGSARMVVVGKRYAVKVANINFSNAIKDFRWRVRKRLPLKIYFSRPPEVLGGIQYHLLRGICENRREARFSKILGDIVVPTRFSFLGIFNVQETAGPHNLDGIHDIFMGLVGRIGAVQKDRHTFAHGNNFGIHDGRLKIIDYGSKEACSVLLLHAREFRSALDVVFPPVK